MKRILALLLLTLVLLGCVSCGEKPTEPTEPEQKDVMILFTSDIHCSINSGFTLVGLKAVKEQMSKKYHVVTVDNGDAVSGDSLGSFTKGEAIVNLMNAVGYDVATPGNHEFDYGIDRMLELTGKIAKYPYVSSTFTHNGELVFKPYVIKEVGNKKIAFVGVSTPDTLSTSNPTYFTDKDGNPTYGFSEDPTGEKFYAAVQKAVDDARNEGAEYVIAMAHLGLEMVSFPYRSVDLAAHTDGIDAILDGHSHSVYSQNDAISMDDGNVLTADRMLNKNGESIAMAGCGTKLQYIGYCRISTDGSVSTGLFKWNAEESAVELFGIENEMTDAIAKETSELNKKLSEIAAHTDVDLIAYDPETGKRVIRNRETNLGDLVADAYRTATGADVAFVNAGAVRTTLNKGDLTLNAISSCIPFGNALCMVKATGKQILDALEWSSRDIPGESGGFLQVSGLSYEIHTYLESTAFGDDRGSFVGVAGEYRVKNVKVNGEALDEKKTYTVASTDYLLKSGGDGTNCFTSDPVLISEGKLDYQTVIDYLTEILGGSVGNDYADIWGQGRITIVSEAE